MAAISVTAANVLKAIAQLGLPGSTVETGNLFGATVTAGQVVYRDTVANSYKLKLAQATALANAAYGIALNGGADGQPADIIRSGLYNPGGTVVVGMVYAVSSAAAGSIVPYSDLASADYVTIIGVGITSSLIYVNFSISGVAKP